MRRRDSFATSQQLYYIVPDEKLQHRTLQWIGASSVAGLACVCVVSVAIGSVSAPLATAIVILATAILIIARYAFPKGR